MSALLSDADAIAPTISRCMLAVRRVKMDQGVAYIGLSLEKRLATVVEMASTLPVPSILKLVGPMADYMFAEWSCGHCDIDAGVDLLRTLESEGNSVVPNWAALRDRTRDGLLESANGGIYANEFSELISVFDRDELQDAEAFRILREAFMTYRRQCFHSDLRECRSVTDYEALEANLDLFHSELGVNVAHLTEQVEEAKSAFEELQAEYEDHNYDEWKERYYGERADNESVTSMFDTLKGDREGE
jgi:hypothetical protein